MNRILGLFAATGVLLSACGGGSIQSPDFTPVLQGIDITFPPTTGSTTAVVAPGGTFQFAAVGLYSTPPGTNAGNAGATVVPCATSSNQNAVCTLGQVAGVSWSVDPVTGSAGAVATVDNTGRATGVRRGNAVVRAKAGGFETTEALVVSGAVLEAIQIAPTPSSSVPTGRNISLKATPLCADGGSTSNANCVPGKTYSYSWSLPATLPADTVQFVSATTGESVVLRTKRFGSFSIDVAATNEEGTRITSSVSLSATQAVLDSISIVPSSGSLPASVALGTPQDFLLRGVMSNDQVVLPVRDTDLAAGTRVEWTKENNSTNSRGDITLEDQTGKTSPNSTLRVTGARLGPTNLSATAVNSIREPTLTATTQLNGSDGINVINATVTSLTQICPASAAADVCPQNVQIPLTASVKFRARGNYSDGVTREVPAERFDWTTRAGTGAVTVDTETSATLIQGQGYTGSGRGAATLVATLKPEFRSNLSPFLLEAPVVVVDAVCADELFNGNGSVTTATTQGTTATAPSSVSNPGNLIDNNPATFATFSISAALTNSVLAASINRPSQLIAASTMQPKSVGALFRFDSSQFNPAQQSQIVLLDGAGNTIGSPLNVTASTVMRGTQQLTRVSAAATVPFTGFRLLVQVPNVAAITPLTGGSFDPSFLNTIQTLLLGGGSIEVEADSACADLR